MEESKGSSGERELTFSLRFRKSDLEAKRKDSEYQAQKRTAQSKHLYFQMYHNGVLKTCSVSTRLVHFHGPHSVTDFVTIRARILKGVGVVSTLNMIPHILATVMNKLVADVASPPRRLSFHLFTEVEQIFRRAQFPCRRGSFKCL